MAQTDSRDLPLSTRSPRAAACFRDGIDLMLSAWPGAAQALDEAIAIDPDFALAHAARARIHAMRAEPVPAQAAIARAAELVARHGSERERSHVDTLLLAVAGRSAAALEKALAHAESWPRDVVILSLPLGAFGLFAFSGMADHDRARVDLCERHARHFAEDDWWFLVNRGWAHAENGDVSRGRALTQRGFDLRRKNANAAHALAHAMYEGGDAADAERVLLEWLPDYDRAGTLHGHLAWHAALGALERGDPERALAVYGAHVRPQVSAGMPVNVVSDSASFLWRLQSYGHAVPVGLWEEAAEYARPHFQKPGFAFADIHMAVLAAATGETAAIEQRVEALTALLSTGALPAGPVVPAICRATMAFAAEDYARCVRLLEPVAAEVVRIGGSGAQREMIDDMRLIALMRGGEAARARALLERRLHRRPSARDARWLAHLPA